MATRPAPATTTAPCAECARDTRHDVLHVVKQTEDDDVTGVWATTIFRLIRCAGCAAISMQETSYFSEDVEPNGSPMENVRYYPTRPARPRPGWVDQLPSDLLLLLDEVYSARKEGFIRLTAMGVRAVVDLVMRAEIGDDGTFPQKLDRLVVLPSLEPKGLGCGWP